MKFVSSVVATVIFSALPCGAQATEYVVDGQFTEPNGVLGQITNLSGNGPIAAQAVSAIGWDTSAYDIVLAKADSAVNTQYGSSNVALWDAANTASAIGNGWNGLAPNGSNIMAMDGDYYTQPLSQTITGLRSGETYTLSFDYAFAQQQGYTGATTQSLSVSLGGANVFASASDSLQSEGFSGWTHFSETIVANSSTEVLSFLPSATPAVPPFALIANVSLASAPLPSSGSAALSGIVAVLLSGRRRRCARR
jgi:hypothetical protein